MKNNLIKSTAVVAILFSLVLGAGSVVAQNTSVGVPVSGGGPLSVPAGYTVIQPDDSDRSDDQIVQLENLTIQNISGSVPGTIYASRDIGGPCREYMNVSGSGGSKIYPCPMAPTILYQISVQSDTILLLRNRSRANISDFAIGDHINVFGFLDPGTSGVQALILRNLDKPSVARYLQLNDLTVVAAPNSGEPPTYFRAARRGIEPCLSYEAGPSGIVSPCPMGVEVSASGGVPNLDSMMAGPATGMTLPSLTPPSPPSTELYRPFPYQQYYNIQITANTRVLNRNRQAIKPFTIQVGDKVNVYGRYIPGTRTVEALIVRDLSVPRITTEQTNLIVTVTNNRVVCVTIPCGQVNGMNVDVLPPPPPETFTTPGGVARPYIYRQVTVNGQAVFRNLAPGRYIVRASGAGYAEVEQEVLISRGETRTIGLFTSQITPAITAALQVLAPNGRETLTIGQSYTIRWSREGIPSDAYLHLSLVDGPTPVDISTVRIGSATSKIFTPSTQGCYTDYCYDFQPGSYRLSAVVYDKLPCLGNCLPVPPDEEAKIIAQDKSDDLFRVAP